MKKNYLLILFMLLGVYAQAQLVCPTSIKTNGGSTPGTPIFQIPNSGPNGCSASWPATITVDGSLTYSFVSCGGGGKLEYTIDAGQTAPSTFEMTIDLGDGTICSYDASGNPITLSSESFEGFSVSVSPNPATDFITVRLDSQNLLASIRLYTISGQLIFNTEKETTIDVSNLNSGMYMLRVATDNGVLIKKIIKK